MPNGGTPTLLANETGLYIGLYGDASIAGNDLLALERMHVEVAKLVDNHPAIWRV